jgi:hypothetical protein
MKVKRRIVMSRVSIRSCGVIGFTFFLGLVTNSYFAPKVNAQAFDPLVGIRVFNAALPGVQICQQIENLSNSNPNDLELYTAKSQCYALVQEVNRCQLVAAPMLSPEASDRCWQVFLIDELPYEIQQVASEYGMLPQ